MAALDDHLDNPDEFPRPDSVREVPARSKDAPAWGELCDLVEDLDWSSTPLGHRNTWPQSLRASVDLCLTSRFPILLWWGPEMVMIYNDAYRPMLGEAKHPGALGSPGRTVWPEIWHLIGPMLDSVMAGEGATWSEDQLLVLDRNGYLEECYFTFSYSPIREVGGRVEGIFSAVTETTDRVLAERRLTALANLSTKLGQATSPDEVRQTVAGVLGDNQRDHPVVALVAITRAGRDDPLAPETTALDPDLSAAVAAVATRARTIGRTTVEVTAVSDAGDPVVALHAIPVPESTAPEGTGPGSTGRICQWVLVLGEHAQRAWDETLESYVALCATHIATALSGIRALEGERRRAEALRQLDETKSAFFTNISHELRTPLTLISGPVHESLTDAALPPAHRERLAMVERNAARLTRMVDAMLDFDRMRAGRLAPEPIDTDVTSLLRGLCASFAPAFARVGLAFSFTCPEFDRTARVDVDMLERIVLNLLSNALKYTPAGSVALDLQSTTDGFAISVSDTGIGIRARDTERIFERFEQVPARTGARSLEGAGIGLAMVKELTELMGGTVTVESRLGEGTTFTVRLPWSVASPAEPGRSITPRRADSFLSDVNRWGTRGQLATAGGRLDEASGEPIDRPRLVVAEDNADMRIYLRDALVGEYDVTLVVDGDAALDTIRRQRPDLLLADVMMPGIDGFTLTRTIRSDPGLADLPIVLVSARAGEGATESGLDSGADDYLVKPFSVSELRARLASNLARARARLRDAAWRRAVMFSLQDPLFIAEIDGPVIEVNEAFTRLLGWSTADGPFHKPYPWWPDPTAAPGARRDVESAVAALHESKSFAGEFQLVARDGRAVWVTASARQVDPTDGRPAIAIGTLRDATRDHEARERRAAAARLSADFGTANDLTTVLEAAVTGFAELFEGDPTVRVLSGMGEHVFTMSGPVRSVDLDPGLRDCLTSDGTDPPTTQPVSGLLLVPGHPPFDCRVWVQFRRPRAVTVDERIVGDLLAEAFALAVDRVVAAAGFADRESHLERAIESHRLIGQAIGILIERHLITPAQAFARLKAASQHRNIKLREIAARVIETGAEPDDVA